MNKCIPISFCVKKLMKAERNVAADTLRGTLLPRMATLGTLAKQRRCHPEGSLPSPMIPPGIVSGGISSQKGISIVKKRMERALGLPGKLPAPFNSRDFVLRFGSGSPLPRINAWSDGYLWTGSFPVRVCRRKYWQVTNSNRNTRRRACR